MPIGLKAVLRDLLPGRAQVPVKYWYDRARGYLEDEMVLLDGLVSSGDRVIDVGGNRGVYAYRLRQLGAVVEVFEPNPTCLAVLEDWAAATPGVALHPVALSSQSGSAKLHIPVDEFGVEHDASASVEHDGFAKTRDQPITLRTLDSYAFRDVTLIKIDVEGHEYSVVEGALETIAESNPALLVEIEQRHLTRPISEIFKAVCQLGYSAYFLADGALNPIDQFDPERDQQAGHFGQSGARYINNFIFLHERRCSNGDYKEFLETYSPR